MHPQHPVGVEMDVQFHPVRAEFDGPFEGREGVLRSLAGGPTVGDDLGAGHGGSLTSQRALRPTHGAMPRPESSHPATDAELIARWTSGDQRAAALLVERHAQPLARFVASLGEHDQVDELVQDTFVRAFQSLDSFRADSSLRTWLFTICKRLLLDRKRSERRRRDVAELDEGDAVVEYDALDGLVAEETARQVQQAVNGLTSMQREVFSLRVNEGMAYADIAEVVGSTEGSCRVHYHNAIRSIKEHLSDD